MYLQIMIIVCVGIFMYRVALYEKRSGWIWGVAGAICALLVHQYFDAGVISLILSFLLAYIVMFAANLLEK